MDHGFTVPICKRPAKEPVEEEDKDAQEKERAMAACAKVSKVDCKYFKPHKHKARAKKMEKHVWNGVYISIIYCKVWNWFVLADGLQFVCGIPKLPIIKALKFSGNLVKWGEFGG